MGKGPCPPTTLQAFARVASQGLKRLHPSCSCAKAPPRPPPRAAAHGMRQPLSAVVEDCTKRWFQESLKQAKAGDTSMQVLVGQMYYSGYGIPRNEQKGRNWISRASCNRSALKLGRKRPGYNASDSDSEELNEEAK